MDFTEIASAPVRQAIEDVSDANGFVGFNHFAEIALYHPEFGYYRADRDRVGRSQNADFFTASNLKSSFAQILIEASIAILGQTGIDPSDSTWVEIGAEPGDALLDGAETPFRETKAIRVGEALSLDGPLVVFSNELFDAQPFHSVIFTNGSWRERGVEITPRGLRIAERSTFSPEIEPILETLPNVAPEGYIVDLPIAANALLESIANQPWTGAFIAFDYGKTWQALCYDTPQGTGRAYCNHKQSPNLLESVGEQDLTCHICWDWLEQSLARAHFQSIALESQESFVLKRAPQFVQRAFESGPGFTSELKGQLRQLIHPTLMGQKFQALSGVRR